MPPDSNHAGEVKAHTDKTRTERYVLTLSCHNKPGIVAAISQRIFETGGNITESQQFDDPDSTKFFMRVVFTSARDFIGLSAFQSALQPVFDQFDMHVNLRDMSVRPRVLILVSRFDHCLADLLYRWRIDELHMDIVGIAANHQKATYDHLDFHGIPFHYEPVTKETKATQEARLRAVIESTRAELVVLARYMQVLSNDFSAYLSGRCINIHHSFLPGFKGARPYHQAFERGVKLIGATAHYVTADLDEGPIIEQDVERITHADMPDSLIRRGRDIERRVLARAVRYHLESRVLLNGHKTVVFAD